MWSLRLETRVTLKASFVVSDELVPDVFQDQQGPSHRVPAAVAPRRFVVDRGAATTAPSVHPTDEHPVDSGRRVQAAVRLEAHPVACVDPGGEDADVALVVDLRGARKTAYGVLLFFERHGRREHYTVGVA